MGTSSIGGGVVSDDRVSIADDENEEASSILNEVVMDETSLPQQQQQGEGMCAAGRWLLGTLFAALGGFVAKNLVWSATAASAASTGGGGGVWGVPYTAGCLALDASLVSTWNDKERAVKNTHTAFNHHPPITC